MIHFRTRVQFSASKAPALFIPTSAQSQTLKMVDHQANSRRPVCPLCSKPTLLCLCSRIKNPGIENSVSVTILQHSLETKHHLNSARIVKLGLKNVTLATVSDVNFEARFIIRLREPNSEMDSTQNVLNMLENDQFVENEGTQKPESEHFEIYAKCPEKKNSNLIESIEEYRIANDHSAMLNAQNQVRGLKFLENSGFSASNVIDLEPRDELALATPRKHLGGKFILNKAVLDNTTAKTSENEISFDEFVPSKDIQGRNEGGVLSATIGKYGEISSISRTWLQKTNLQKNSNFNEVLLSSEARESLAKGFVVKKFKKRPVNGGMEFEEYEEFEIEVPPKSVLLFPTENALGVDSFAAGDFDVKNLIVLDGTWAKAKRMYNENPWLMLLPHLKLDLNKMSLYGEVRHQPKVGYLSTIESIVYALKAIGNDLDGLDSLLDVFESMIGDQRRCKDERLSKGT